MKRIKQFRYYSDDDSSSSKNSPGASYADWASGSVFNTYYPITQLGIQALPGTKFYLNKSADPIIIGSTGIYELDLNGEAQIKALSFGLKSMQVIRDTDNACVLVDIIYDKEEEEES